MNYIVLFRGDDTDFTGNQQINITINTDLDLTGCKATFRFLDFIQEFDDIPEDKKLNLVVPSSATKKFPLGPSDAELYLTDSNGKIRTIANRIHILVTQSVKEAYENDDQQAITVVVSGGIDTDNLATKEELNAEIERATNAEDNLDNKISSLDRGYIIVDSLEELNNIPQDKRLENKIYLVPKNDGSESDLKDEYIVYIDENTGLKEFELIGSSSINLDDYYTKQNIDDKLREIRDSIDDNENSISYRTTIADAGGGKWRISDILLDTTKDEVLFGTI